MMASESRRVSNRAYYYRNQEREKERLRERHRNTEKRRAEYRSRIEANPERMKARDKLRYAVRQGKVEKPNWCEECNIAFVPIEGHHHDYSKPFDVEWLCKRCHGKRHRKSE